MTMISLESWSKMKKFLFFEFFYDTLTWKWYESPDRMHLKVWKKAQKLANFKTHPWGQPKKWPSWQRMPHMQGRKAGKRDLRKKKQVSERVSLGVTHIIRPETLGETFWREKSRQESRRQSRIGLYAWLPARLIFLRGERYPLLNRHRSPNKLILALGILIVPQTLSGSQ